MSVCAFNSLPDGEHSYLFIVAAFSNKYFPVKRFLPVNNSYLLAFPDDKAKIQVLEFNSYFFSFINKQLIL